MKRLQFENLGTTLTLRGLCPQSPSADLREFMFANARRRRRALQAKVATVIGSAGKTSVKEMLGQLLTNAFISPANQNTKLALALQVLRLREDAPCAVFEMGARRVGDFNIPLSYLCPDVVTLLNIGTAHVGEFGSLENLLQEKLSPLESPEAKILVIPAEDPRILKRAQKTHKKILTFGSASDADVRILQETASGVKLAVQEEELWLPCPFNGPAKAVNIAAAIATALALGAKIQEISQRLAHFHGVRRRFESLSWLSRQAIDDAFNASPESMRQGLLQVKELGSEKRLLLVLGSMLELGAYSEQEHRALGQFLSTTFAQNLTTEQVRLITIGNEAAATNDELKKFFPHLSIPHFSSALAARSTVETEAHTADIIYFKASKGLQLQNIFKGTVS